MPKFPKGHKFAKGGKRPGAGRPSKEKQQAKILAAEIAKGYIEKNVKPLMETYLGLAAGQIVERMTAKGKKKFKLSVDPATTRDAVAKLVPSAKQQIELSGALGITVIEKGDDD